MGTISIALAAILVAASSEAIARPKESHSFLLPPRLVGHWCLDNTVGNTDPNTRYYKRTPMRTQCPEPDDDLEIIPTGMHIAGEVVCRFLKVEALAHGGYRVGMGCRETAGGWPTIGEALIYPTEHGGLVLVDMDDDSRDTASTSQPAVPSPPPIEPSLKLWDRLSK